MHIFNQEITDDKVIKMYLDYLNDFLSVEGFASFYGMSEFIAAAIIKQGRKLHIERVG